MNEKIEYTDIQEGLTTIVSFEQHGLRRPVQELTRDELHEAIGGLETLKLSLLERLTNG